MGTSRCWKVQGGGIRVWEGARQLEDRYIYLNLSLRDALLLLSSKDLPLLGLALAMLAASNICSPTIFCLTILSPLSHKWPASLDKNDNVTYRDGSQNQTQRKKF